MTRLSASHPAVRAATKPARTSLTASHRTAHLASLDALRVEVPCLPPTNNRLYEGSGKARHRVDEYEAFIGEIAIAARGLRAEPTGVYALHSRYTFPTPNRQDAANRDKAAQDALCGALGIDDSRIVETHIYSAGYVPGVAKTELWLERIG